MDGWYHEDLELMRDVGEDPDLEGEVNALRWAFFYALSREKTRRGVVPVRRIIDVVVELARDALEVDTACRVAAARLASGDSVLPCYEVWNRAWVALENQLVPVLVFLEEMWKRWLRIDEGDARHVVRARSLYDHPVLARAVSSDLYLVSKTTDGRILLEEEGRRTVARWNPGSTRSIVDEFLSALALLGLRLQ